MTTEQDSRARVSEIIGQMSPLGPRQATAGDRISDDLGYDSLAVVELALILESEFDLQQISEEDAIDIVTVGDVQDLVVKMGRLPDGDHGVTSTHG